jgi:hypothetical protein
MLANNMYEAEKRSREERKRKREEDEANAKLRMRSILRLELLTVSVSDTPVQPRDVHVVQRPARHFARVTRPSFPATHSACSFNVSFDTPEFVVVGMQSDGKDHKCIRLSDIVSGKSSFIEALLGFQFNIVESSMRSTCFLGHALTHAFLDIGTRRPLILQMMNNPANREPVCRFRKESRLQSILLLADEWVAVTSVDSAFEEDAVPVFRLSGTC